MHAKWYTVQPRKRYSPLHWRPSARMAANRTEAYCAGCFAPMARRDGVSIEFLITSLVVVATPGTGVLYTLAAGLTRGSRASVVAAFGCTLGIVPHMLAAITGLAALLHTSALAFQTLKYLGVAYLLFMAWATVRERGALREEADDAPRPDREVIASAVLVNA